MKSRVEVLLRLLVSDEDACRRYLPESIPNIGFDLGGLFIPKNAAQIVFFVGQLLLADASREWSEQDQRAVQKLCGLLWLVSEYGGDLLPEVVLFSEEGFSYHYDGLRAAIRDIAQALISTKGYHGNEPARPFEDVFLQDCFALQQDKTTGQAEAPGPTKRRRQGQALKS